MQVVEQGGASSAFAGWGAAVGEGVAGQKRKERGREMMVRGGSQSLLLALPPAGHGGCGDGHKYRSGFTLSSSAVSGF